jgi:trigger factor
MKSTVEKINPVQYRLSIEVASEEVNTAFENALKKIQRKAKIQGFRPGKAPLNVIKKLYGGNVSADVHQDLVNKHLFKALDEQTIRPIAAPVVDSNKLPVQNEMFAFSAVVDIMPEINIPEIKGVEVAVEKFKVKEETIDREVKMLRRRQAKTRSTEAGTKAASGHLAALSHTASVDGKDLPQMNVSEMTVNLGENEIFEDLEKAILGMSVGESKSVSIKIPETNQDPEITGKNVLFNLTLNDLKHMDVPELNDDFAKELDFESADALVADIRKHLDTRAEELRRQRLENAILDKLLAANPFEVPPAMVDQVIDSLINEQRFGNEDERKSALANKEFRNSFIETAKRRTQNTLILWHVTQKENLQASEAEIAERVNGVAAQFGIDDPKRLAAVRKNLEARVRENMVFEKAMDYLVANAKISDIDQEI